MTIDLEHWDFDDLKTIEDLTELLNHGHEFDVMYKNVEYHIENEYYGYLIGNNDIGDECAFDTPEEFMEKATIGGDLLKDVIGDVYFTWGA